MKKLFKYLFIILTALILFTNLSYAKTKEYSYLEAGFKALFPVEPKYEKKEGDNISYKILATKDGISYSVIATFADINLEGLTPSTTDQSYEKMVKSADVKKKTSFKISGKTGIESKFITSKKAYVHYRVFVNKNVIYQIMVITIKDFADDKTTEFFYDSFKLIKDEIWKVSVFKKAGFNADFPSKPKFKEERGKNKTTFKITAVKDEITYAVVVTKSDKDYSKEADLAKQTFENFTKDADIKKKKSFDTGKYQGWTGKIITKKGTPLHYKVFVSGKYIYQAMVIGKKDFADIYKVKRFFSSLELH